MRRGHEGCLGPLDEACRALKKEDQVYGQSLTDMAKKHSSEASYSLDDPQEAAAFSVMVEMMKEMDEADCEDGETTTLP